MSDLFTLADIHRRNQLHDAWESRLTFHWLVTVVITGTHDNLAALKESLFTICSLVAATQ
jgi:hypothetical protein